jgi:hypothetical protein
LFEANICRALLAPASSGSRLDGYEKEKPKFILVDNVFNLLAQKGRT